MYIRRFITRVYLSGCNRGVYTRVYLRVYIGRHIGRVYLRVYIGRYGRLSGAFSPLFPVIPG